MFQIGKGYYGLTSSSGDRSQRARDLAARAFNIAFSISFRENTGGSHVGETGVVPVETQPA
jgi:hypothetical protein